MASNPDLVIRVAANVAALQTDMAAAVATLKAIEGAAKDTAGATSGLTSMLDGLGAGWVARIAEGQLLRDAVREVLSALKDMAAFIPEVAMKGAAFGDIEEAFVRLTGQAGILSTELLGELRAGTHGTIDDFDLMKRANQDLAAGLNLTTAQSRLLADGAFALAKATGVDVKTALDSMSDAMVTGRTKAIALLTGKIDLKAAEDGYAAALGGTAVQLSAEQKLEADREAILNAVGGSVARLGEQTDSLDEKVKQGQVSWANFQLELGKAIAQSPVIAAGFDTLKTSLSAAFGGDVKDLIAAVASAVDGVAIKAVDVGIGTVAAAGVMIQAWSAVSVPILGLVAGLLQIQDALVHLLIAGEALATKLHIADPEEVARANALKESVVAMTASMVEQTAEAAKNAAGASAQQQALEKLGGSLFQTRDAMIAASTATKTATEAHAAIVPKIEAHDTSVKALKGTTEELEKLEAQYAATAIARTGTVTETEIAKINEKYQILWAHLESTGKLSAEVADQLDKNWAQALGGVGVNWDALKSHSIQALQDTYDRAQATFSAMMTDGLAHSQAQIEYFRHIRDVALDALHGISETHKTMAAGIITSVNAMSMAQASFTQAVDSNVKSVLTLAGAWITAADAKKLFDAGNTIDLATAAQDPEIMALLHMGWSLKNAEQIKLARQWNFSPKLFDELGNPENSPSAGERVKGYEFGGPTGAGGLSMLHGGEYVVPKEGALVSGGGGSDGAPRVIQLVVDGRVLAQVLDDVTMKRQRALGTRFD